MLDQFTRCSTGQGRTVVVGGGFVSGKSEILRQFHETLTDDGVLVLSATGTRAEHELQAGIIDQLFRGTGLPPDVADRMSRLVNPGGGDAPKADIRTAHEVCQVLLELSRQRPLVICVDDIQDADTLSLHCLRHLRRRISSARILLVAAEAEQPARMPRRDHGELTRRPDLRLQIGPLSPPMLRQRMESRLGAAMAEDLGAHWYAATGGNELLVRALFEDLAAGRLSEDAPTGPAYARAVWECVHHGDHQVLAVATAVAILDEATTPRLAARLAQVTPRTAEQIIQTLEASGLVGNGRFRHRGAIAAVLAGIDDEHRTRLRSQAAELLYEQGAPAQQVAAHLADADRLPAGWPVDVLRESAAQALVSGEGRAALRYLELARTTLDDHDATDIGVTRGLVRVHLRINPVAATAHVSTLWAHAEAGEADPTDLALLTRHALWFGDWERARCALSAATGRLDARSAVELWVTARCYPGLVTVPDLATLSPETSEGDAWDTVATTLDSAWRSRPALDAELVAEQVLGSFAAGQTPPELAWTAVVLLVRVGRHDRAVRWCDRLVSESARADAPTWQAAIQVAAAALDHLGGEPERACARVETALSLLPPPGWGIPLCLPLAVGIEAGSVLQRTDVIDELVRTPLPEGAFASLWGVRYLCARARGHLIAGRALAAMSDVQRCSATMRSWNVDLPSFAPWHEVLADASELVGHTDLNELPGTGPQPAVLSESEQRVAELAGAGCTNRQISEQLFITVSTVEQHLTRIYRKLGVSGRTQLAARMPAST